MWGRVVATGRFLSERMGFRPALDPNAAAVHVLQVRLATFWFEVLKRLAVLAALSVAGRRSELLNGFYYVTLIIFTSPAITWLQRYEFDLRTRNPRVYVPHLEADPTTSVAAGKPPAWAHSMLGILIWGAVLLVVHITLTLFVIQLTRELATFK